MKKLIRSYISFTRTERIGLVGLCSLLIILIAVRATMSLWVHPHTDAEKEKQLITAWEAFRRSQPTHTNDTIKDFEDAGDELAMPLPDTININTTDSATLVRLKGIGPVTAGKIIQRRNTKGFFTNISQLSETGGFSKADLGLLAKHLVFAAPAQNNK